MNQQEALTRITAMTVYWPQYRELSQETLRAWAEALREVDTATFDAGLQRLKLTSATMPHIVEVIQAAADVSDDGGPPSAQAAWAEARRAMRTYGRLGFSRVTWSHPIIGVVCIALGWDDLCMSTNEVADRSHFVRAYEVAVQERRRTRSHAIAGGEIGSVVSPDKQALVWSHERSSGSGADDEQ